MLSRYAPRRLRRLHRELQVLELKRSGLTQKQIALKVGISQPRVSQLLSGAFVRVLRQAQIKEDIGAAYRDWKSGKDPNADIRLLRLRDELERY